MTQHMFYGMGMVINEAQDRQSLFPAPSGFPVCGNFEPSLQYARMSRERWQDMVDAGGKP